ncbi:PAS domain-containing serine/threonine-protein kinase isoform X1 [Galleria mellonella]|uniref:PAS domain-containing serine/threonine-protein kinase isoform X1 n=1 Tax=Galleria mellonella TaxID=7137 RepID=A0A6J3C911_GALME|nr:PAS domain-containing serine/threonine-protein kinase isoform X1 [Galleria mellonella]
MEGANIFYNRTNVADTSNLTPVKPKLGKFIDVYSPEHLNLTPKAANKLSFNDLRNECPNLFTPEKCSKNNFKCRTVKPPRLHHVFSNCSFEGNQSFPRLSRRVKPFRMELETPTKVKPAIDLVRVDGPNGLRFNTSLAAGDVTGSPALSQTDRLQQSINPSKAVFTIEPNSSKILIVNNKACSLLGYSSGELCGLRFSDLLRNRNCKTFNLQDPEDGDVSEDGTIVLLSGKVVELLTKDGSAVQVSLWIRQLDSDGPCLVVAEPVSCKNVLLTVEADTGLIISCSGEDAALLFQAESSDKLVGLPIASLIPSIQLPAHDTLITKSVSKQKATGRTLDGGSFPLCLWISKADNTESSLWSMKTHKDRPLFEINVRVTYNVSGLLVVDESGIITACNHHFAMLTFGKPHSEVVGHHIEEVIHNFCRESDMVKMPDRHRNMTLSPVNNENGSVVSDTDEDSCGAFNGSQKSACISLNVQPSILSMTRDKSSSALCLDKSCSLITHTPTPTQDMVSSISTTEQRNDISALPDVTSGMSGISIEDENYCPSSISKSRSENILRSEQSNPVIKHTSVKPTEKSDSIYYTSQHSQEVTPTGNAPRVRLNDPSLRLSFDSSKYRSVKVNLPGQVRDDKSSISVDFCDSNETSADFLTPINEMPPPGCEIEELPRHNGNESVDSLSNDNDLETQTESAPRRRYEEEECRASCGVRRAARAHVTSTPQHAAARAARPARHARDGTYRGLVLHRDGTQLSVLYTVSSMQLSTGRVACVWLGVQLASDDAPRHATLASSLASTADNSLVLGNKSVSSRPQSMSLMSQCGEEQTAGEYSKHYVTLKQIGKGAYGCVKMAYRRSDKLLAVAKFILKEKVGAQFWVDGPDGRRLPLELSLLLTLKHPNIVSVVDVFENDKYFQMVMEKHGAGMDLFEFIERRPRLDEPLLSYIFRQIGQAVEYLHSLNILHRDIKDENVIIDNKFHVKLIDFGSATFMSKDTLFSTFYGTTEYCSPEVLAGNKYAGPELEMWSMGITLYVLTFFVNPFSDIEDTIQGPLALPQLVSEDLEQLLRWMLCKEPSQRCTVSQLMAHPWIRQPVTITNYVFHEIVDCDRHEANPEMYYNGSLGSPRSGSPASLADPLAKERSNPSEVAARSDDKNVSRSDLKRGSQALQPLAADRDAHSDNYSLRSSADILDISSKPVSEAALTDISSDATGHAACDIDYDCDHYECDSWDECEQDSFS